MRSICIRNPKGVVKDLRSGAKFWTFSCGGCAEGSQRDVTAELGSLLSKKKKKKIGQIKFGVCSGVSAIILRTYYLRINPEAKTACIHGKI